eukprot:594641_1
MSAGTESHIFILMYFTTPRIIACSICGILCICMLCILTQMIRYLVCKRTIELKEKYVFVRNIRNKEQRGHNVTKQNVKFTYGPHIRYGAVFSVISYIVSNIFLFYAIATAPISNRLMSTFQIVGYTFWYIGRILMHSVFTNRLKSSFNGTKWMYKSHIFKRLYIALSIICTQLSIQLILWLLYSYLHPIATELAVIGAVNFVLMILLDITCSIYVYILFQRKVLQLIQSYFHIFQGAVHVKRVTFEQPKITDSLDWDLAIKREQTCSYSAPSSLSSFSTKKKKSKSPGQPSKHVHQTTFIEHLISDSLDIGPKFKTNPVRTRNKCITKAYNHTKLELINTITQHTILICFSLVTSVLPILICIVRATSIIENKTYSESQNSFYFECSIVFDTFINALCLFLHFPFSLNLYNILCKSTCCLHHLCLLSFGRYVETQIV